MYYNYEIPAGVNATVYTVKNLGVTFFNYDLFSQRETRPIEISQINGKNLGRNAHRTIEIPIMLVNAAAEKYFEDKKSMSPNIIEFRGRNGKTTGYSWGPCGYISERDIASTLNRMNFLTREMFLRCMGLQGQLL